MGTGSAGIDAEVKEHDSSISTKTDGSAITEAITSATVTTEEVSLDITDLNDTGMDNLKGQQDLTISLEGNDPKGSLGVIEHAFLSQSKHYFAVWPSNTSLGFTGQFLITEFSINDEIDSPTSVSIELQLSDSNGYTILT